MIDENIVHEIDEIEKHLKLLKKYLSDDYKFSYDTLNCFENTPKELNEDESDQTSSIAERIIHWMS